MLIINPGSEVVGGTYEDAEKEAKRLATCMKEDGITDIILFLRQRKWQIKMEGLFLLTSIESQKRQERGI